MRCWQQGLWCLAKLQLNGHLLPAGLGGMAPSACLCPMTWRGRAHCSTLVQASPPLGTRLVLRLRQQPEFLLSSCVSSCLVVPADIVNRSGIWQPAVTAVGLNGYPAEPKPSMVSAVDFTLRRLASYLLHGEPQLWWCCTGASEVVAPSLVSSVWFHAECGWVSPAPCRPPSVLRRADLHPGHAISPGHTPDQLVRQWQATHT